MEGKGNKRDWYAGHDREKLNRKLLLDTHIGREWVRALIINKI